MKTTLPGDWTVRGTVVLASKEDHLPDATRNDVLRAVALMIMAGQTVTRIAHEDPTGKASTKWTRIIGENRGADRSACRVAARAALAAI